ncbi:hypothetical protein Y032_0014g2289 [Ancylostoma ceylanicum]|nr:hypothetical protein Y032_0014g2289 [Ancylostoma ceylanicum]
MLTFAFLWIIALACKPVCFRVSMDFGIVPTVYNNCTCMQHHHRRNTYDYMKKRHVLHPKCATHYRTLKFRNASTGSTLFRQKVARSCIGESRTYINQSDYDREEKEFITRRSLEGMVRTDTSFSSWVFGFRTNLQQLQRDRHRDNHLRFG